MKKLFALLAACILSSAAYSLDIGGITLPDSLQAGGSELHLNGAGIRDKWLLDLYVGGLYLPAKQTDGDAILQASEPMAIRLHIISGMITSEKMTKATVEGFENATHGETAPLQTEIDQFLATFAEPIKEGDIFDFIYLPGAGVQIVKNGQNAQLIKGDVAFKSALFGIWISDRPAQKSLKKAMLGLKG
ncbi:chalcone isomerase family protein [Ketobacter sp.]|uniref:chalcone isomerase family protein n=1 Tax=Ketobacter sp. TaxID=2083498 RepID=UPI000F193899|nr:chalcone isomerase family protein [Ketobacter sp.]RLT97997.1 MAG: chalcone isomerase [Ketobacter sp.]